MIRKTNIGYKELEEVKREISNIINSERWDDFIIKEVKRAKFKIVNSNAEFDVK